LTVGYLINRTRTSVLDGKIPYSVLYGRDPTYDHLHIFGSICYAHKQGRSGDKFDSRSRRCIFVGYPYGKKGWHLYDLEIHEFFVSREVKFYETEFPFTSLPNDDLVLPSNFGYPSIDLEDCDDLGVGGEQEGKLIMSNQVL